MNKQEMLNPTNRNTGRCARWCAAVVLLAVCALTLSVATRYGSVNSGISAIHTFNNHAQSTSTCQRLDVNTAGWMPPVIDSTVLQTRDPHARVASVRPIFLKLFPESSRYKRPPPASLSIA
ncbi:MAG TPA: hypothetical protein VKQ11_23485 [Candidatus Sulfotelmatobacter sp.]|nr:hypothetical protein [Candidatus Sulfotelmatobacter sp.]